MWDYTLFGLGSLPMRILTLGMVACMFLESWDAQGFKGRMGTCIRAVSEGWGGQFVSVPGCQRNTQRMRLLLQLPNNGAAA